MSEREGVMVVLKKRGGWRLTDGDIVTVAIFEQSDGILQQQLSHRQLLAAHHRPTLQHIAAHPGEEKG